MIKIAAILLTTFFSAGYALDAETLPPSDTNQEPTSSPVPASGLSNCLQHCDTEFASCTQECTVPMCYLQCQNVAQECYNQCYIAF